MTEETAGTGKQGARITVRYEQADDDFVAKAADELGVDKGTYVRMLIRQARQGLIRVAVPGVTRVPNTAPPPRPLEANIVAGEEIQGRVAQPELPMDAAADVRDGTAAEWQEPYAPPAAPQRGAGVDAGEIDMTGLDDIDALVNSRLGEALANEDARRPEPLYFDRGEPRVARPLRGLPLLGSRAVAPDAPRG